MMYSLFNINPCTTFVSCTNPTNASDETEIIALYNELSFQGENIPYSTF